MRKAGFAENKKCGVNRRFFTALGKMYVLCLKFSIPLFFRIFVVYNIE